MAYAPTINPKIAVAVIVENAGWGGSVAAPIARKVFDAWLLRDQKTGQKPLADISRKPLNPNMSDTQEIDASPGVSQ